MQELATLLERERRLLEMVLFKLVEARHLLAQHDARFLPWASAELERAVGNAREAALLRAMAAERVAVNLRIEGPVRLRDLADCAEAPWDSIFVDHAEAMAALLDEIRRESAASQSIARDGLRGVDAMLAVMSDLGERVTAP